ncbi:hypothetical protein K7X08_023188 [Anisodus acutangulus]|uniref:Uncharacterized protein n=1 Tax=Anisodus acutangulus TaxID=402998 RepID=A0A9Q1LEE2_9SOLA|nr:hypothetical protein K7X08_023188 [Anisodus acutangulus]
MVPEHKTCIDLIFPSRSTGHSPRRPMEVGKLSNGLYVLQLNGSTLLDINPLVSSHLMASTMSTAGSL